MSTSALSPYAIKAEYTPEFKDHIRYQLAEWGLILDTEGWTRDQLMNALTIRQTEIINSKGNLVLQHHANIANAIAKATSDTTHNLATSFRNKLVYQIVPTAIVATIATALFNVATIYSYFNPASTGSLPKDGTNENCTEVLKQCKDAIPTLQERRDGVKADWKACLKKLEFLENCTNGTLANHTDLLSQIKSCQNSTVNNTGK